jgi:hypothetical protein
MGGGPAYLGVQLLHFLDETLNRGETGQEAEKAREAEATLKAQVKALRLYLDDDEMPGGQLEVVADILAAGVAVDGEGIGDLDNGYIVDLDEGTLTVWCGGQHDRTWELDYLPHDMVFEYLTRSRGRCAGHDGQPCPKQQEHEEGSYPQEQMIQSFLKDAGFIQPPAEPEGAPG